MQKQYNLHKNGVAKQEKLLQSLLQNAAQTVFGKEHQFSALRNYVQFKEHVPLQNYESLAPYIDKIKKGEEHVLWHSPTIYFAKTSGTTSGTKYIPITQDSIKHHISAARNSLFAYLAETGETAFFTQKMIFLQGSPELETQGKIKVGRLSGIVYHHVPFWLHRNRKPSYQTNCIADWEQKVEAIVEETYQENMSVLSGIPPWCVQYFEKLLQKTAKASLKDLFPALQLYVYGGLNYEPYKEKMDKLLGQGVDKIETYPASEGFFAYQDSQKEKGLLLNLDGGIFYEFIEVADYQKGNFKRIYLADVALQKQYVLVVSSNAGLWAYDTGDTIKFVSLQPYRIQVTGRVKHFISAFGEHVIQEEVEKAMQVALQNQGLELEDFTVAPFIDGANSCHEWYVALKDYGNFNAQQFVSDIDFQMQEQNIYYKDLRKNGVLKPAKLLCLESDAFYQYFKQNNKLGGQNKVQHLSNDRTIAEVLQIYVKKI